MSDRILLRGIHAMGRHGVYEEEKLRRQPFSVDIEMLVDTVRAGETDDLVYTVDYSQAAVMAVAVITDESHELMEKIAQRIADEMLSIDRVEQVTVEVRKLRPAMDLDIEYAALRITRERDRS